MVIHNKHKRKEKAMNVSLDHEYILRKQAWEDYQDDLSELENELILEQLNKCHNRKGYLLADYMNEQNDYY